MSQPPTLAQRLVLGGMIVVMATLMALLVAICQDAQRRDQAEQRLLFRDHSYRSEAELRACLLDQRKDGLVLTTTERPLFGPAPRELVNTARHTTVAIENRGDFRIIRAWRRGETTLRPGEIVHLLECLGRPAG